jgi:hypothetical protein
MGSSSGEFVSPLKVTRSRGGARVGAGRKKKYTPEKVLKKSNVRTRRLGAVRKDWLSAQQKLLIFITNSEFGPEYDGVLKEYVTLGKQLGLKGLFLPSTKRGSSPSAVAGAASSSSDEEVHFSHKYIFSLILVSHL